MGPVEPVLRQTKIGKKMPCLHLIGIKGLEGVLLAHTNNIQSGTSLVRRKDAVGIDVRQNILGCSEGTTKS